MCSLRVYTTIVALFCAIFYGSLLTRGEVAADYKIRPQDLLTVDVLGEKDLGRDCRVSSSGTISFAWLNGVEVKGKTPAEVETILKELLDKDYLVDPQVIVAVKEYNAQTILVMGAVSKPGSVLLPGEKKITIIDAIGLAGGTTKLANDKKIEFTRNGKSEMFSFENLKKMIDQKQIIYLEPGDIIKVHETFL
jgi:polysaccharide export outer membrane protein